MTPNQTTQYFNVDELRNWLKDKQISFDFTTDQKITTAVHLAKLNPQKIKELEMHIGAFLNESLFGPSVTSDPKSASPATSVSGISEVSGEPGEAEPQPSKGPVTLPDNEPIE